MDLEHELTILAEHVDWPPTPELRLALELESHAPPRRRGRPLAVGIAFAAALALAAAFAVPQSRGSILRFLHLGAVTIERVDARDLPAAQERPLSAGVGPAVSLAAARRAFGPELLVPPVDPLPPAHLHPGGFVSFVFAFHGEPVLLSEFPYGSGFMKKLAAGGTSFGGSGFDGHPGIWIAGAVHDVFFPGASPRLAGNTLLWERSGATYRLEGRTLAREDAVALARSLTGDYP